MLKKQIIKIFFRKLGSAILNLVVIFGLGFQFGLRASAAAINLSVSPSSQAVATTANITLSFTPVTGLPTGSTIVVSYQSTYTATPSSISSADVTVTKTGDSAFSSASESGFSSTGFTITLTTTGTLNTTNPFSIVIGGTNKLQSPVAASNNSFIVSTSVGDFGGVLQYVGQANTVLVQAKINPTISFVIRNSADTANTNICDFGTVDTSTVYTCSYRLKVGTNAANGYTVAVANSGSLTDGVNNIANAAVGSAGSGGTNLVAGTEGYGITITPGSVTGSGGTVSIASAYNAGATNAVSYVNTTPTTVLSANKPNNPTSTTYSSLVTQKIAISSSTPAGFFTKTETYTVTYNF
jgi:hypothetical protein